MMRLWPMAAQALKTRPAGAKAAPCGYIFLTCAILPATSFARCIAGAETLGVIRCGGSRLADGFHSGGSTLLSWIFDHLMVCRSPCWFTEPRGGSESMNAVSGTFPARHGGPAKYQARSGNFPHGVSRTRPKSRNQALCQPSLAWRLFAIY